MLRRTLIRRVWPAGIMIAIGGRMAAAAHAQVVIDNFTFSPTPVKVTVGTIVTWVNHNDIPHSIVCPALKVHSHALDTMINSTTNSSRQGRTTISAASIRICAGR